jgi:hypothetical protein
MCSMEQSNDGRAGSDGDARHGCSGSVVDVRPGNSPAAGIAVVHGGAVSGEQLGRSRSQALLSLST